MTKNKSFIDYAVLFMQKKRGAKQFEEIAAFVAEQKGMSKEEFSSHLGSFLTDMLGSGKFIFLSDGKWDLKERQPSKLAEYEEKVNVKEENANTKEELIKKTKKEFTYSDKEYEDDYSDGKNEK